MKHIPIVVKEDGLYLDMERMRRSPSDVVLSREWEMPPGLEGLEDESLPVEAVPRYAVPRYAHPDVRVEDYGDPLGPDPVVPSGLAQGIFEAPPPPWQPFDLDAADEEMLRRTVRVVRRLLREALDQLHVETDPEAVDVLGPPPDWLPEYGSPPTVLDVQVRVQLTWHQVIVLLAKLLARNAVTLNTGALDLNAWSERDAAEFQRRLLEEEEMFNDHPVDLMADSRGLGSVPDDVVEDEDLDVDGGSEDDEAPEA